MKIVRCPNCSDSYPDYLFEFKIPFRCDCGVLVSPVVLTPGPPAERPQPEKTGWTAPSSTPVRPLPMSPVSELLTSEHAERDRRARELRRRADRISYLIVSTETPLRQIESEMRILQDRCRRYFPEIRGAYEQVYEARFQKLWREFRLD
ncbi:MAG: hypothetical protein R3E12_12565 [Candidatus Eisenbacteria bacterium]|uniref:Uncharacterized protein n=1 Tax=Eiseniibacteriota bacterium TaxID=2212470 RepID=A0A956LX55_UNCEI|nr:hypothetical protein [Candidatus Eisenbacteria bacterium]